MADIWSLGITIFCFAFLRVPYDGKDSAEILKNILNSKPNYSKGYGPKF